MIDEEMRGKIAKLSSWARDLIRRLEHFAEPMMEEAVRLRKENTSLKGQFQQVKESNEDMMELFRRAALGGSDYAAAVVEVLDGYEILPTDSSVKASSYEKG